MATEEFFTALSGAAFSTGSWERFCAALGQNPDDSPGVRTYLEEKFLTFREAVERLNRFDEGTRGRLLRAYLDTQG